MNFTIGQKFYMSYHYHRKMEEVQIKKIGTKYVYVESLNGYSFGRFEKDEFEKETDNVSVWTESGGFVVGKLWFSKVHFDRYQYLQERWGDLRSFMNSHFRPPDGVNAEAIQTIFRILKGEQNDSTESHQG